MPETHPPGTMTAAMKDPTPDLTSESLRAALFDPTNDYCRFCGNLRCEGHVDDCEGLAHADAMGRLERVRDAARRIVRFLMGRKPVITHLLDSRPLLTEEEAELADLLTVLNGELVLADAALKEVKE